MSNLTIEKNEISDVSLDRLCVLLMDLLIREEAHAYRFSVNVIE